MKEKGNNESILVSFAIGSLYNFMFIFHTESHNQWGGQERRVFSECRWMSEHGHYIIIAAPMGTPIYEKSRAEGWEVYPVGFTRLGMVRDFFKMRSILRKVKPHVLNTHGNTDSKVTLAASTCLNIPCIIRSRHSTPAVRNSWYNRLLYNDLCHLIFTTAGCITDQLIKDLSVSEERIFTLPSGIIPPSNLPEHDEARRTVADMLGLNHDSRFIGFIGRFSREKGLPVLIHAFNRIQDTVPAYHLILVGDGKFRPIGEKLVQDMGIDDRIHFMGYRDDPWLYFRAFDCHVIASTKYEGTPQVVLQAMFAGCPVIGTNIGGIPDVIFHKKTGLLVNPDDAEQMGLAILEVLQDHDAAQSRAKQAYQFVLQNHTIDAMGKKILDIYSNILKKEEIR